MNSSNRSHLLSTTLGLLFVAACATAKPQPEADTAPRETEPADTEQSAPTSEPTEATRIEIDDYQGQLHSVEVDVAGETMPFVFDTGAGLTVVTPDVAEKLGCEPFGRLVGYRMSGDRIDFPRCDDVMLEFAGVEVDHETVGVFDLMALLPEGWTPMGGLVGLTSFDDRPFTLDLRAGVAHLETPTSLEQRVSGLESAPIQMVKQASGFSTVVLLGAPAADGMLWLELDSGSAAPLILAPHAARALGVDLDDPEQATHVPAADGRPEMWKVPSVTLDLGSAGVIKTSAVVRDIIYDANLGAPLMEKFQWTFDLPNEQLWVRRLEADATQETGGHSD